MERRRIVRVEERVQARATSFLYCRTKAQFTRVAIAKDEYGEDVCGSLVDDRRGSKNSCCLPVPNSDLLYAG
jgi:hypothetical protein